MGLNGRCVNDDDAGIRWGVNNAEGAIWNTINARWRHTLA